MGIAKERFLDVLLGGLGGAVIAAILTLLLDRYFDSIERDALVSAKDEILEAKEIVSKEIRDARERESKHLLDAIVKVENARAEAELASREASESLILLARNEERVAEIVASLEKTAGSTTNEIAEALRPSIMREIENFSIPVNSVLAFNLKNCPKGWSEFKPAYGRFIRGIDKSGSRIDPEGQRLPGVIQEDDVKKHSHTFNMGNGGNPDGSGDRDKNPYYLLDPSKHGRKGTYGVSSSGGNESRPKNVALLFCTKG